MRPIPPDHDRQTRWARSMPSSDRMPRASSVRSVNEYPGDPGGLPDGQSVEDLTALLTSAGER